MYESPKLLRYGTFRELTLAGWSGGDDHLFFKSISGSNLWPGNTHVHDQWCGHSTGNVVRS